MTREQMLVRQARDVEPEELARHLGISGKRLRAWLRRRYPRSAVDHGTRWTLTPDQVGEASRHFGADGPTQTLRQPAHRDRCELDLQAPSVAATDAGDARRAAALKYRPARVRLLLVAEAPPRSLDRYFYFEDVSAQDSLFRYVVRGLYGEVPTRQDKRLWLTRLHDDGVCLIDVSEDPDGANALAAHVQECVARCRALAPEAIILIKSPVYDAMLSALRQAGLPVVNRRVPFPGSGQQALFEAAFADALDDSGIERPIRSSD